MSVDVLGLGALALVTVEWLGLGWLSGISFPEAGRAAALASWALRVLVGAWLIASAQLLLALFGVGFGSIPIVLGVAAAGATPIRYLGRPTRVHQAESQPVREQKPACVERREVAGWLLLGLVLLAAVVRALVVPESGWDAYAHWGLRAQAFASAGTLVNAHSEHEYYPPLVSLLEAWLYAHRGLVSIDFGKTVWAVIGGAFSICLAWHLRQSLSRRGAWLAPYLAVGIVVGTTGLLEDFWTGQADLALTAYLSLATLAVWRWQQTQTRLWLIQAALFAAAASLTKFEGLPRIGVVALAVLSEAILSRRCRRAWSPTLALVLPAAAAGLIWTAFELTHGIAANGEHIGAFQPLAVGGVLVALVRVFAGVRTGGGPLVAVLAWLATGRSLLEPPLRLLVLVVLGQALATLIAFLVSATSPELEVATSATRLVEQFLPLALFAGGIGLARTGHL